MLRHSLCCLCLILLATAVLAQTPPPAPQPSPSGAADWTDLAILNYRVVPNVVYGRANNTDLKLDLYAPKATQPVPVVMIIHGGGWMVLSKENYVMEILPYLQMGFAAVNVEYRLGDNSPAPAAVEDCRCALRWIMNNADNYKFDLNRIVVTGGSAGGHLALTTGLLTPEAGFDRRCAAPQQLRWETSDQRRPKVAAIVNWYGITDVAEMFAGPNAKNYAIEWFGSMPNREELARQISPINLVRKDSPPVLTIHGDKDTLVPYTQAVRLHQALQQAGVPNQLVTIPGGGHGGFSRDESLRARRIIRDFLMAHHLLP